MTRRMTRMSPTDIPSLLLQELTCYLARGTESTCEQPCDRRIWADCLGDQTSHFRDAPLRALPDAVLTGGGRGRPTGPRRSPAHTPPLNGNARRVGYSHARHFGGNSVGDRDHRNPPWVQ